MATFKAETQKKRKDNTYIVYIRCTHNRSVQYIRTDMYVIEKYVVKGEIKDQIVLSRCAVMIGEYLKKLNFEDITNWTVKEVVDFITISNTKIPFIPYCNGYINGMINDNRERTAKNYRIALNSFISHFGKDIMFQDIKSNDIKKWIKSLNNTARAKEMYPTLIKAMFKAGADEYNDYDNDKIKISNQPFRNVEIPTADVAKKRSVGIDVIRKVLSVKPDTKRSELAQDVAKLIVYLVGINTVDLFETDKDALINGKLCYNRRKTMSERKDKAYIEISVRAEIEYLFGKYKGQNHKLFDFGYKDNVNFNKNVNKGLMEKTVK